MPLSKYVFSRWQAILSVFDFDIEFIKGSGKENIEFIKGSDNYLPDFLTREFLHGTNG